MAATLPPSSEGKAQVQAPFYTDLLSIM